MSSIEEVLNCFYLGIKGLVVENNHEAINNFTKSIDLFGKIDSDTLNKGDRVLCTSVLQ